MASSTLLRHLLRRTPPQPKVLLLRSIVTNTTQRYGPPRTHEHSRSSPYLSSWKDPPSVTDPREAKKRLELLRREYDRKVSECRKQYMYEVEMQRLEKVRKDEVKREAAMVAKEERKAAKKEADEVRAAKHRVFEQELRQTLLKERAEKLERWRAKEALREKKKGESKELLRKQSSMWIAEADLEKKIHDSLIDVTVL